MPKKSTAAQYVDGVRSEITKWEKQQPGYLAGIASFMMKPIESAAEALIPNAVQEVAAKSIEGVLNGLGSAAEFAINEVAIQEKVDCEFKEHGHHFEAMDEAARHYWNWHIGYAVGEGAAAGAAGLPGLIADIPAIFTIALRLIKQIATCYGYDIHDEKEREYVLQLLNVGTAANVKTKAEFVVALKQTEQQLIKRTWKQMAQMGAPVAVIRSFAKSLGIQITKRKALQMIPVIGALIGASFNGMLIKDVGEAAYMSYRRRRLAEMDEKKKKRKAAGAVA